MLHDHFLPRQENISLSGTKILGALLCTVIMYISLSNTSFMDAYGNFSYPMLAAWWTWARWVMLLNIIWICQGVWFFLSAMYLNYKIRRPWPKLERDLFGREVALDLDNMSDGTSGYYHRRPQNYLAKEGTLNIMWSVLISFFGLLTTGLIMKSRVYVQIRKQEIEKISAFNLALKAALGPELFQKFGHFILASRIDPEDFAELTNPYEIHRILNVPLGPAIKIAKKFAALPERGVLTGQTSL